MKISDKNLQDEKIKALKNLTKNKNLIIQKAGKPNTVAILNKDDYISRLNQILDDTSKCERLHVEEDKALNHIILMKDCIIELLISLKNQSQILEKNYGNLYPSGSKPGMLYGIGKIHTRSWRMEFKLIIQFCLQ